MTLLSRIIGWAFNLPPAETRDVVVERDLKVPMPDGAALLADHYYPRKNPRAPTILIRSPYGRTGAWGIMFGRPFAERGFQVVIQSCRGTFGSTGDFRPFHNERADGLATLAWLKEQPWFSGELCTFGASYMGYVQWAVAAEAGPELKAMALQVTGSEFRSSIYAGESFWLDTALTWLYMVAHQENSPIAAMLANLRSARVLKPILNQLPLRRLDEAAIGKPADFYRDWVDHNDPDDPFWKPLDFSERLGDITAPAHLVAGFYDVFLPRTLADYRRLREAGKHPYLTIGPWTHMDTTWLKMSMSETIAWYRAHLFGDTSALRKSPVQVFVMGAGEWREFDEWPPPGYRAQRWHLQPNHGLAAAPPISSEPDHYRYDPADPTPSVGGSSLSGNSGPKDNRALEARKDVLVYTGAPLESDLEAIGPVTAELYVKSSLEHTDFFARLCDVSPNGKSMNVCDGLVRLTPKMAPPDEDGCRKVTLELWATAYRFKRGHRVRLQVSSGSHPRFTRNTGSGEPLATATRLVAADQTVFHDPSRPSAIVLPVRNSKEKRSVD